MQVWEVTPHPGDSKFDCYIEKDWAQMLNYVSSQLDFFLERYSEQELKDGVTLRVRLIEMDEDEYTAATGEE